MTAKQRRSDSEASAKKHNAAAALQSRCGGDGAVARKEKRQRGRGAREVGKPPRDAPPPLFNHAPAVGSGIALCGKATRCARV